MAFLDVAFAFAAVRGVKDRLDELDVELKADARLHLKMIQILTITGSDDWVLAMNFTFE
jgi:hypothetical protein